MIGTACQTSGPPPALTSGPQLAFDVPSPLTGPGREAIAAEESDAVGNAWADLLSGKADEARATVARFSSPQSELLRLQIDLMDGKTSDIQNLLQSILDDNPQYGAAWVTLSVAAESQGDESVALRAARQSSRLWSTGPFAKRAEDLERRWITARIETGNEALSAGQPMEALSVVEKALELDPENQAALLTRGESLVQLQQGPEAEAALARLGTLPEALILRAELASSDGRWQRAMDLLGRLPDGHPQKDQTLRRAQLMWRMSILPPHVQEALNSKALTREQLAVLLVAMVPSLEIEPGGSTPLMTDVIDLPSQRAILTAARLDIMSVDRTARLFHPGRIAALAEIQTAIEATCHIAALAPPLWCEPGVSPEKSCIVIEDPIDGVTVVEVILSLSAREAR